MGNARIYQEYVEALTTGTGNARIFQNYVEVLLTADSAARVFQDYIEVLASGDSTLDEVTSNTLSFTQVVNLTFSPIVSNTIVFDQIVSTVQTKSILSTLNLTQNTQVDKLSSFSNTLNLSQDVQLALIVNRDSPQNLTFTQDVSVDHPLGQIGESDLILTQSATETKIANRDISQNVTFGQSVNVTFIKETSNTVTFGQNVDYTITTTASNDLTLTQDVVEEYYKFRRTFSNFDLTQVVAVTTVISEDVSNTLDLAQTIKHVFEEVVSSDLSLTQTVSATAAKNLNNTLSLTHVITLQKVLVRPVTNTLHFILGLETLRAVNKRMFSNIIFTQSGNVLPILNRSASNDLSLTQILYKDAFTEANNDFVTLNQHVTLKHIRNLNIEHSLNLTQNVSKASVLNFSFIDTLTFPEYRTLPIRIGDLNELTIRNVNYTLLHPNDEGYIRRQRATMILSVPGRTVILPVPLFGDGEGNTDSFTMSYAVDGTVYTTVRKSGTRTINFEWDLKYPKAEELKEFIWDNNSKAMTIENWKGEIWIVRLLTNPIDFVDNLRPSLCESDSSIIVGLQFEGVRIH